MAASCDRVRRGSIGQLPHLRSRSGCQRRSGWCGSRAEHADGVGGGLGPVAQVELGEDAAHVVRRRLAADVQALGDLGVRQPGAEEPQHLLLPVGEHPDPLRAGAGGDAQRAEERRDPIGVEARRRAPRTRPGRAGRGRRRRRAGARRAREPSSNRVRASSNGQLQAGPRRERRLQVGGGRVRVAARHRHPTAAHRRPSPRAARCPPTTRRSASRAAAAVAAVDVARGQMGVDEQVESRRRDASGAPRGDAAAARGCGWRLARRPGPAAAPRPTAPPRLRPRRPRRDGPAAARPPRGDPGGSAGRPGGSAPWRAGPGRRRR